MFICQRTTQAQRPGPRAATIANRDAMPGSLHRMVRWRQIWNVTHLDTSL